MAEKIETKAEPTTLQKLGGNALTGGVVAAIIYVLMQFGLIGPTADAKIIDQERRLARVETRIELVEANAQTQKEGIRQMLEPLKMQIDWMAADLKEIKQDLRGGAK